MVPRLVGWVRDIPERQEQRKQQGRGAYPLLGGVASLHSPEDGLHDILAALAAKPFPARLPEAELDYDMPAMDDQVLAGRNHWLEYLAATMHTEWMEAGAAAWDVVQALDVGLVWKSDEADRASNGADRASEVVVDQVPETGVDRVSGVGIELVLDFADVWAWGFEAARVMGAVDLRALKTGVELGKEEMFGWVVANEMGFDVVVVWIASDVGVDQTLEGVATVDDYGGIFELELAFGILSVAGRRLEGDGDVGEKLRSANCSA